MPRTAPARPQGAKRRDRPRVIDVLRKYIEEHGLKMTEQRKKILETFLKMEGHFAAEDLYTRTKRVDPRVGYTTVYRTLRLLCECGLAHERQFKDGPTLYELGHTRHHHDHLVCVKCGKIVEFENDSIERLQKKVAEGQGFELIDHRHELYGHCKECRDA